MRPDTVARRYARALFELADERGLLDPVRAALAETAHTFDDERVERVLTGPVPPETKRALLTAIASDVGAPPVFRDFLLLLSEHDRLQHVSAIRAVFDALVDRHRGVTRATVRSAAALTTEELAEVTRVFGAMTGKQVVAEVAVDPVLLAGVIVEADGRVYDGSLRTQLAKLREQMATGS
jgi:F-type H+-transporting ATPase subunit delta